MVRSAVRTSLDPVSVLAVGATGLVALLVVLMGVAAEVSGLETGLLTRDPATSGELPWYAGALSHVTVMLWAGGAVAAGLAAALARSSERQADVAFAAWLAVLGLDDALLLHDQALPSAGVPELAVLAVHALISLVVVTELLAVGRMPRLLVTAGAAALVTSVVVDVVAVNSYLVEDGAKLLGVSLWAAAAVWHVLDLHHRSVLQVGPDHRDAPQISRRRRPPSPAAPSSAR